MENKIEIEKVITDKKDFSISELNTKIMEGDLILTPEYQREYVYDTKKASCLVESALMGIPIPIVYFSEEDDGIYEVIDGQQRIQSFVNFLNNELILTGLSKLSQYNGKLFKDLDKPIQRYFKTCSLSTVIISNQSKNLKYDIFERLNQGAVSLKPQEIRNCIYRGNFNNMLRQTTHENKELFSKMFHENNTRMKHEEFMLKFFTYRSFYKTRNPSSCTCQTMNKYMDYQNKKSDDDISQLKREFLIILKTVEQVLGKDAFFSYNNSDKVKRFLSTIYDSIMISFCSFNRIDLINNSDNIREEIEKLKLCNEEYDKCIRNNTNSSVKIKTRINIITNAIHKIIDENGTNSNEPRCFNFEQKQQLFHKDTHCAICGQVILGIDDCEVDHIIAFSNGGHTNMENAQLVHSYCNKVKSNKN